MEEQKQLANIINKVLIAKGFYFLDFKSLADILRLLGKEIVCNPSVIREMAIEGLTEVAQNQQNFTEKFFVQPKFQSISAWAKEFLYSIIQEVISAKHRILRKSSQENRSYSISEAKFPILPLSGYAPQVGFLNQERSANSFDINADHIQSQKQMNFSFSQVFKQNSLHSHQQNDVLIKNKLAKVQLIGQQSQKEKGSLAGIQNVDKQDCKGQTLFLAGKQASKIEKNGHQVLKRSIQIDKSGQIRPNSLSQPSQRLKISQIARKKKPQSNCIQIQTDLSCIQIQTSLTLLTKGVRKLKKGDQWKPQMSQNKKLICEQQKLQAQIRQIQHIEEELSSSEQKEKKNIKQQTKNHYFFYNNQYEGTGHFNNELSRRFQYRGLKQNHDSGEQSKNFQQMNQNQLAQNQQIKLQSNSMSFNEEQKIELLQIMHHQEANPTKFDRCICNGKFYSINIFMCETCLSSFHLQCLQQKEQSLFFNIQCPICKIRSIDPFQKVEDVIGEFYIKDINSKKFQATVNLSSYSHLKQKKQSNKCFFKEKQNDIQIRCLRIEKGYDRSEITWPDEVIISINNRKLTQTYGLLINSAIKKRVDNSIVITQQALTFNQYVQEQDFSKVTIQIQYKQLSPQEISRKQVNNSHTYILGVYFIQRVKLDKIYQDIIGTIEPFQCNYIKKLFSYELDNSQLEVDFMVCKIRDPYNGNPINFPVRGVNCMHLQCFDLKTYLYLIWGCKSQLWRCPVCGKQAKKFKLDQQQLQLIKKLSELRIIPQEIIFLNKGDLLLKLQVDKENKIVSYDEEFEEEYSSKSSMLQMDEKKYSQRHKQQQKALNYRYYQYFPKIELIEVQFTGKECFNKPKVQKNKMLKKLEKEKPKRNLRNNRRR